MTRTRRLALAALCAWASASTYSQAADTTAAQQLAHWSALVKQAGIRAE